MNMPPAKKQKVARTSGASGQGPDGHGSNSASEHVHSPETNESSNAKSNNDHSRRASNSKEDKKRSEPYEYICFHRPLFDVEDENWLTWSDDPDAYMDKEEVFEKLYKPILKKEKELGVQGASPKKHPGHKWVIMYNAWLKLDWLTRKARYCDPDKFDMNLYNDWYSWGLTEILENMMIEFNNAYHSKGPNRLEDMWVVISAVGLWLNKSDHLESITMSEDGESVIGILDLVGCAALTILTAIEKAGELKPDSRFLDLALVIGYYIEFCYDLFAYELVSEIETLRKYIVEYFKKANLDPTKATARTKNRIERLEQRGDESGENVTTEDAGKENESPKLATGKRKRSSAGASEDADEDTWGWDKSFQKYKKAHDPKMGGTNYDITKMTRAERKAKAFDGKDPLAGVSAKDLMEDLLNFA